MILFNKYNTIFGDHIESIYGVNPLSLCYLILKHDLAVLDPKDYSQVTIENLLEIMENDPYSLSENRFFPYQIESNEHFKRLKLEKEQRELQEKRAFEQNNNEVKESMPKFQRVLKKPKTLPEIIEDHETEIKYQSNVFSLLGKVWFVKFQDEEWGIYPDHEKYKYIAVLLNSSDHDDEGLCMSNTDLISEVKGTNIDEFFGKAHHSEDELSESDLAEKLTPDEIDRFKDIGYELLEKIQSALRCKKMKLYQKEIEEFDKYRSHLLNQYGIKVIAHKNGKDIFFKKLYRPGKEIEKSRQIVKNQVSNAIKDFKKRMPALFKHLKNSITTKSNKSLYHPEADASWHISF